MFVAVTLCVLYLCTNHKGVVVIPAADKEKRDSCKMWNIYSKNKANVFFYLLLNFDGQQLITIFRATCPHINNKLVG